MLAEPPSPSAQDVQPLNAPRQMALSLPAPASTGLDDVLASIRQDDKNKWGSAHETEYIGMSRNFDESHRAFPVCDSDAIFSSG